MSQSGTGKSKELKITTKQVISPTIIKDDERKAKLMHVIKTYGEISEKGLNMLVKELKDKGFDLGYQFIVIGDKVNSQQLRDDVMSLTYLGYLEVDPKSKKIKISSQGEEALSTLNLNQDMLNKMKELVNGIKSNISLKESEDDLRGKIMKRR